MSQYVLVSLITNARAVLGSQVKLRSEKGVSRRMRWGNKRLVWVGVAAIFLVTTWLSGGEAQLLDEQIDMADAERIRFNPSPRLGGMGLLGITVEDENNEINLFDYIGSPAGLLADRDSTTVDFQYDFGTSQTDWHGVDPFAYPPNQELWPNFLEFGRADLETEYSFQRLRVLSAYRSRENFSIGGRLDYNRSGYSEEVRKFDVTYITARGEEDEAVADTLFLDEMTREVVDDIQSWVFDLLVDKQINPKLNVAGHAMFSFEHFQPQIFHSPDSVTIDMTRPVTAVDTTIDPSGASRLPWPIPNPESEAKGVGGGLAFSYDLNRYVTLGASGDIFATYENIETIWPIFRQVLERDMFMQTGKVHGLFRLGEALEGAVKHESRKISGDGAYSWSFGCPLQGGGFDFITSQGKTADHDGWEERTGARWLIRVPETSIRLAVQYESGRGETTVEPDSAYSADVFLAPEGCGGESVAGLVPVIDGVTQEVDFEDKDFTSGAALTLWFGVRPLTVGAEYRNRKVDYEQMGGNSGHRDLSVIRLGAEFGVTRRITVRAGGVWGEERFAPIDEVWDESTFTLGGSYVLVPGLRHIEAAYMFKSREPDFDDVFRRETNDHRLTFYTRIFF